MATLVVIICAVGGAAFYYQDALRARFAPAQTTATVVEPIAPVADATPSATISGTVGGDQSLLAEAPADAASLAMPANADDAADFAEEAADAAEIDNSVAMAADTARNAADAAAAEAERSAARDAKRELDSAIAQMQSDGEACFAKQQYGCALTNAANVLRLRSNDADAIALKTRAESAQAEAMNNIDIH